MLYWIGWGIRVLDLEASWKLRRIPKKERNFSNKRKISGRNFAAVKKKSLVHTESTETENKTLLSKLGK